jgi:carboxyl-terminal processing protease
MNLLRPTCSVALAAVSLALAPAASAKEEHPLAVTPLYTNIIRRFAAQLPERHLSGLPMDDSVSARAWTNYLTGLDYDRLFFTAGDIESFAADKTRLDDELKAGRADFALRVYTTYVARVRERAAMVEEAVLQGFDTNSTESFVWRRRKSPWPADRAEQDDLWRRKILNEYLSQVVSRANATNTAAAATNAMAAATNATGAAVAAVTNAPPAPTAEESIGKRYRQFRITIEDNDADGVLQSYLTAFAQAYDPHSAYMSQSSSEDFDIDMKLSLFGIGAMLRSDEGTARVEQLIQGGPAERDRRDNRLRPGDKIVAVGQDGEPLVGILHWPLPKVVRLIRGPRGTRVVLQVIPASDPSGATTKLVDLVRDEVKLEEQAAKGEIREVPTAVGEKRKLGVIVVPAFYAAMQRGPLGMGGGRRVTTDVLELLSKLRRDGAEGLVLDLRNNGGGSLGEAISLTGLFIPAGPVVQVHEADQTKVLPDMDPSQPYAGPLVVLVSRVSASASEIFAAALQDYGRAVIVGGSKTHGKGTVQQVIPMQDGNPTYGSLKVTISEFFRVTGRSTQKYGVTPDIVLPSILDSMEIGEEVLPNALQPSVIRPVLFRHVSDVTPHLAALRDASRQRCETDPRFAAYRDLVSEIGAMNRTNSITLSFAQRRRLAEREKELARLQRQVLDENGDAVDETGTESQPPKDKKEDLVLEESLRILSDLIDRKQSPAPVEGVTAGAP